MAQPAGPAAPAEPPETTDQVGARRSPRDLIVQGVLTLALVGLILWLLLSNVGELSRASSTPSKRSPWPTRSCWSCCCSSTRP